MFAKRSRVKFTASNFVAGCVAVFTTIISIILFFFLFLISINAIEIGVEIIIIISVIIILKGFTRKFFFKLPLS